MQPEKILEDQRITVKRGRMNGLGFEPLWNAYFDFYLNSKYVDPPLLELEDVTFHLYLRKNLNDSNPDWHMPSVRYMMKRFRIGYAKYAAMIRRLDRAKLLVKVSGVNQNGNTANDYVLSDPVPHLDEFLALLDAGLFDPVSVLETPPVSILETPPVAETETPPVSETETLNRLAFNQTSYEQTDDLISQTWSKVKELLKQHLPKQSYYMFIHDCRLIAVEESTATIATANASALTYLEHQMAPSLRRLLSAEMGVKIETVVVKTM